MSKSLCRSTACWLSQRWVLGIKLCSSALLIPASAILLLQISFACVQLWKANLKGQSTSFRKNQLAQRGIEVKLMMVTLHMMGKLSQPADVVG